MTGKNAMILTACVIIIMMILPLIVHAESVQKTMMVSATVSYRQSVRIDDKGKISSDGFYQAPYTIKKEGNYIVIEY
jgi:hypothetical protein